MRLERSTYISLLTQVSCAALLLSLAASHAAAQNYLPPSRYESQLPSPSLLYPSYDRPLYPPASLPYNAVVPPAEPVAQAPLGWPDQDTPTSQPPAPLYSPEPSPTYIPLPETSINAPSAPTPSLLPTPPSRNSMPRFEPVATLESEGHTAPLDPAQLQRQPIAQTRNVPVPEPVPAAKLAPEPILQPPVVARPKAKPEAKLDAQTQDILLRIPGGIDASRELVKRPATLHRFDPDIEGVLDAKQGGNVTRHESMGVAIEVRQPSLDVTLELKNAYDALLGGQPQIALQIYKDILQQSPSHSDALFGVATTYHRMSEPDLAKPFYIKLLTLNPKHRDGLTNFLTLVAQEAPEAATSRLEYLARQNPNFSAIPALLGMLYDKMGREDEALQSLIRAVRMEPENVAYKYNLAILFDKYGMTQDASTMYSQLLEAGRSGIALPAAMRDIQERLIYINNPPDES